MDISKYKKPIITIVIIVVAFVAYNNFLKPNGVGNDQFIVSSAAAESLADGREVLLLLEDLQSINLNPDFFAGKTFVSLQDFSIPLDPEPSGRTNPFSPIGE
ncbi:hypothetical protein ACFLY0_00680 [Patescibacteria group bacterium]